VSVLAHRVDGQGEPLLLLNGGMMSFAAWDGIAGPLAERHLLVRCDFRGQLRSPGTPPSTFEGHARDLVDLLDHLGVARCHVAGASYGAFAAIHLAALAPERVATLAAITAADHVVPEGRADFEALVAACRGALGGGPREPVYDLIAAGAYSPAWAAAHAAEIAARRVLVAQLPETWFEGLLGLLGPLEDLDVRPLLPRITCPALVLLADGDRAMPLEHGLGLAKGLPRGECVVVPGSGHALVVEQPDRMLEHLLAFLARNPLAGEEPVSRTERNGGTP
jgi:pimeloyl-ACP methyl ester carboxylesterase